MLLIIRQLIEIWETFLMQLDAEDENFVPPAGVVAANNAEPNTSQEDNANKSDPEDAETRTNAEPEARV